MRELSQKEKQLIEKLIELYAPTSTTTIGDVLFKVHQLKCLKKVKPEEWEQAYMDVKKYRQVQVTYYQYKDVDFELEFYESIALIEYLEHNRYIILSQLFEKEIVGEDDSLLSPIAKNGDGMSTSFNIFNNFTQDLWRTLSSTYIITNSLVDFAKDFKTPEQRRFEKQLKEARRQTCGAYIAAAVSFLGLLVALILPFCTKTKLAEIDEIKQVIQSTKTEIPTVIETKVTNDTIKVDFIKPAPIKKK